MSSPLLTVDRVEKHFGPVAAVDGVSFSVDRGEIFALLGPNGAGKTTLIRMLIGLTRPDRGTIRYDPDAGPGASPGTPPAPDLPRALVGYLPEERGLYPEVPVLRTLVYFGTLRGMDRPAAARAAERWLERLSLRDRMHDPLKALSRGNQQKVQFISAVLHRPRFVLLDEPFAALDPLNQDLFLRLFQELRDDGSTIVLSAHQMQLVERVADRILVLKDGRRVLHGTLPDIRRRWTTGTRLILRVATPVDLDSLRRLVPEATPGSGSDPGVVELFIPEGRPLGPTLAAVAERLEVVHIESHPLTLHDVYVETVTGAATGGRAPVQADGGGSGPAEPGSAGDGPAGSPGP